MQSVQLHIPIDIHRQIQTHARLAIVGYRKFLHFWKRGPKKTQIWSGNQFLYANKVDDDGGVERW